ncbi:fibronectin type III domain-containing protein [Patescibacteria group bacterium]|nr:fibronectin type III domain-containing protein [Patescibacteria group bacterium]
MINFINKFKIPTILGLGIIIAGLIGGVYLVLREQVFFSRAAPSISPQNITLSNITDTSATISWQTNSPAPSFITYGIQTPKDSTALDERDTTYPTPRTIHYVTLANLSPQTPYQFKIQSGKTASATLKFETSKPLANKVKFTPVIGSAMMDNNTPLNDGIAYLSITEAVTLSALIKNGGNFLIPLSKIQAEDLPQVAKLTIISDKGEGSALISLKTNPQPFPPIKLGQSVDLTALEITSSSKPTLDDLNKYDLNEDEIINTADYAIVSSCSGKDDLSCAKADVNKDGKIDQQDLDMMFEKLKTFQSQ